MSRDPDARIPRWGTPALYLLLFLFVIATLALFGSPLG
jgi:hypothetical protein